MKTGVFAPLRVADYRRLWTGQIVSVVGDKINQIAMAMMVYSVTKGSMLQVGIMLGVTFLPAALFGLPAGVYVDRWDRRVTMVWADIIRAVLVVAIPFVVVYGVGWAYVLAFIISTVSLFFLPAKRATIPEIVPPGQLMAANSLDNASEAIAELLGLALGAALVALLRYPGAFAVDSATFVFSAGMIFAMRYRQKERPEAVEPASVYAEASEGLTFIWHSDVLRQLSGVYTMAALFGAASIAICYALAFVRFNAGAPGLALLDAGIAVGALVGSMSVARSGPDRAGLKFLAGVGAFGLSLVFVAAAGSIWLAVVLLAVGGLANMWFFIPATTIFQTHSNGAIRGRVMAAYSTVSRMAMVLGVLGAGAIAESVPIPYLAAFVGLAAMLVSAVGFTQTALREA